MLLINRIHNAKTGYALAESRAVHSKVLSFSPSKKNMKKNTSAAQKNDAVPSESDVLGQYFQNFIDEDDLGLGLFANDGDNGAFDKSFVDYSSDSDSEALFQKHRGSKKINLPSSNARSKLMGSLAQTTKGVPDPSSFIDDFGGSFVFEDEGDIIMNTGNNNNSFGNDDFGGDDFGDSFGNDGDENIDSSGSPKSPSSSLSLSPPHSLLDGANKSGNETSSERPRKTARLYKIVGDANTKLSSATILLWMNNKGPTMKVRKISRHHIPKHRRSLDFNAAMNRPAYSQSRNIYTKTNIAWRRFMEYVPPSIILRQRRRQAGVRSPESPEVGRNDGGASVNGGVHGGEHLLRDEEMKGGENKDKRKRASLGDDDIPGQYDNGFDDWGGNDFGNDDFGDEINGASALMSLSGSKGGLAGGGGGGGAAGGGGGGAAGGAAGGGKSEGRGSRWTAVSESDVIWTLEQHGMKEGISVDFHSACFELLDVDDDIGMTYEKRKRLPSRAVAASYFFSLLIASNNFKVRARQEEPWGRIRVESMRA